MLNIFITALLVTVIYSSFFIFYYFHFNKLLKKLRENHDKLVENAENTVVSHQNYCIELQENNNQLKEDLQKEIDKNSTIISQKKSSEVRIGQVTEHLIPFLSKCKYDPKSMHFQGNPIDFIVYDLEQAEIIFLEIKTGNSTLSKKQKLIKNIIKSGKVYFEEMRVDTQGIKTRRHKNTK